MPDGFLDRFLQKDKARDVKRNVFTSRAYDYLKRQDLPLEVMRGGYAMAAECWDKANK